MFCDPYSFPGSSYKIIRNSNVILLVRVEEEYQIVLLTPCTVIARGADLSKLELVWKKVNAFLGTLPSDIIDNPPELFKEFQQFSKKIKEEIANAKASDDQQELGKIDEKPSNENQIRNEALQRDVEEITKHIFENPSLVGIAGLVGALPQVEIEKILQQKNSKLETILHMAASKNNIECVRLFIELGATVNQKDKNGWTPLHCACFEGFTEICEYLIRCRSSMMALTYSRTLPIHYLVRSVTDENWNEQSRILESMLYEGVDISAKDSSGKTPLHHVLIRGRNLQCVEYLVKHGAAVNIQTDGDEMSPVHYAATYGNVTLLKLLLEARGNPTVESKLGNALDIALMHKHHEAHNLMTEYAKKFSTKTTNTRKSFAAERSSSAPLVRLVNSPRPRSLSQKKNQASRLRDSPLSASTGSAGRFASRILSVEDQKKKEFGIDDNQKHLDTYTCKLNKTYGVLYIWQRYISFENMLGQKIVFHFKDVISMKKYLVTSAVELVVKDKGLGGDRKILVLSQVSVSTDVLYNLLNFLISVRNKPDPVVINGIPLFQMLGSIKYPEAAKDFARRFEKHIDASDQLIKNFVVTACVLGNTKIASTSGYLYLTHRRIGYYNNYAGKKKVVLLNLNRIISMAARGQGIEIYRVAKKTKEIWYFSFATKDILARAFPIIEKQWQLELQNSGQTTTAILGANTNLGQEISRYFISNELKFRPILIHPIHQLDSLLTIVHDNSTQSNVFDASHTEVYRVEFDASNASEQLARSLSNVSRLFFVLSLQNYSQQMNLLSTQLQDPQSSIQHITIVTLDGCDQYEDPIHRMFAEAEMNVKNSGIPYTIFRIGLPMQFLFACVSPSSKLLAFPLKEGKVNLIDLLDIVPAVLTVLLDDNSQYDRTTYRLLSENYTNVEDLRSILQAHGDPKYNIITDKEQCAMMMRNSLIPDDIVDDMIDAITNLTTSGMSHTGSNDLQEHFEITPKSLSDFLIDNKKAFEAPYRMYFSEKECRMHENCFLSLSGGLDRVTPDSFQSGGTTFLTYSGFSYALFRAFDTTRTKELDVTQYIHGLSILLEGSLFEQIDFSFRMFDGGEKGFLTPHAFSAITDALRSLLPQQTERVLLFGRHLVSLMDPTNSGAVTYGTYKYICSHYFSFISSLGLEGDYATPIPAKEANEMDDVPPKGYPIDFHHEQWELVWYIMCGLSRSVYTSQAIIQDNDIFKCVEKYSFQPNTVPGKEIPSSNGWTFVDVAPTAFRLIRELFAITPMEYLASIGIEYLLGHLLLGKLRPLRTMSSTGRSGSIFFISPDNKFFIKTLPEEEDASFCRILRDYYDYLKHNPNTLMTRYCGLHRIREGNGPWMSFVVMQNLFASTPLPVHEIYDLKGSTVNRHVKVRDDQSKSDVALKDNDFHHPLQFGSTARAVFFEQIEKDIRWMEHRNICDYSLLVGIHFRCEGSVLSEEVWESAATLEAFIAALDQDTRAENQLDLYKRFHNGIMSCDRSAVYFIGIIDTLTEYNLKKRGEHFAKSLLHDATRISAVPPSQYRRRYQKYVISIVK